MRVRATREEIAKGREILKRAREVGRRIADDPARAEAIRQAIERSASSATAEGEEG